MNDSAPSPITRPDSLDDGPLVVSRSMAPEAHFDITAMIDLVFMMNIYFLVTTIATTLAEIDLPPARHVVAADQELSIMLTLIADPSGKQSALFVGEKSGGSGTTSAEGQVREVTDAVESGIADGKKNVVIKAEKTVPLGDVFRVAGAATAGHEDMKLYLAVMEKDAAP